MLLPDDASDPRRDEDAALTALRMLRLPPHLSAVAARTRRLYRLRGAVDDCCIFFEAAHNHLTALDRAPLILRFLSYVTRHALFTYAQEVHAQYALQKHEARAAWADVETALHPAVARRLDREDSTHAEG